MSNKQRLAISVGVFLVVFSLGGCPIQSTPSDLTGDATAGAATFAAKCAQCHTQTALMGRTNKIRNNMGSVSLAMTGITLTDQEVVDLQALLTR